MHSNALLVRDVMTRRVAAVPTDAGFKEIIETMSAWGASALPVVGADRVVVGVVSEADLLAKEEFSVSRPTLTQQRCRPRDLAKATGTTAEGLMSSPAVTVPAMASLPQAARLMARENVKRLPVVDSAGRLEGIVSRSDLLKVYLRPDEDLAADVQQDILGRVPKGAGDELRVRVTGGVVTFTGVMADPRLVPALSRMARAVPGVVDVVWDLDRADGSA
ncbi:CBS domain-containing protein [Streptomyces sp. FIT100]|uniref:CBS domain-containing protein n=1 Tax=Streptomyces sp. FIT100 TaxID=2837956 RepID=UPI0021C82367|nr:CBS domain-containing protein [Streptomyces sp. FIT100]UUN25620.1 CBS domain-containing protein [Streptomyces sp. FIT100]